MTELNEFFRGVLSGARRPVILGAGSEFSADDAAGVMITDALIQRFGPEPERFRIYSGGTAPECFTGEIKRFGADHVVIVDAADFGGAPGEVSAIDPSVVNGVSFSTHMLPLKVMLDYLNKELECGTTIVGIQPASLEFGGEMTRAVYETTQAVIQAIEDVLNNLR